MKKVFFFIGIALISIITGCKKYDEGPSISLRTKMNRLCGEWEVTEYMSNNENVLHWNFDGNLTCSDGSTIYFQEKFNINQFLWTFSKDGNWTSTTANSDKEFDFTTSYDLCSDFYNYKDYTDTELGTWKFTSSKEKLSITYVNYPSQPETWTIKELKEKEMKVEYISGSDKIKMTFTKR